MGNDMDRTEFWRQALQGSDKWQVYCCEDLNDGLLLIKAPHPYKDTPHCPFGVESDGHKLRYQMEVLWEHILGQRIWMPEYCSYWHRDADGELCCEFVAPWWEHPDGIRCPNCGELFHPASLRACAESDEEREVA